jgi:hypothetical protein
MGRPSGRESLNGAAEPGRDLLEIDGFDVKLEEQKQFSSLATSSACAGT